MQITLTNTGKRYNREWIFRHLDFNFLQGGYYAITGPNGSGKSTLLQVIAGAVMQSEGKIAYQEAGNLQPILANDAHQHLSYAAPYLELIEEMTATELLSFHAIFKHFSKSIPEILAAVNLDKSAHKQIRYFSSGMKQRLKLGQAFFSDTTVLLLDEPLTNLDEDGIATYQQLISDHTRNRLVIVSSNDKQEYSFCKKVISIMDYK